jgi:N-acetylneuraminic acid mutarotase
LPRPLHHVNAAVAGGKIWVVGALEGPSFVAVGDTLVFDPATAAWSARATMPPGTERGSSFVAAIGDVVYVAGGLRGGVAVADFSAYDAARDVWTSLPALPAARDHGVGVAVGTVFLAIGGRDGAISAHTRRVDAFDPATSAWTARAPMPTSRAGFAAAVARDRVAVAGGEGNAWAASGVFQEVELYDPAMDTWTSLASMRTPRHGTGAAAVGDVVYVPGGATVQALGATAVTEALSL